MRTIGLEEHFVTPALAAYGAGYGLDRPARRLGGPPPACCST